MASRVIKTYASEDVALLIERTAARKDVSVSMYVLEAVIARCVSDYIRDFPEHLDDLDDLYAAARRMLRNNDPLA